MNVSFCENKTINHSQSPIYSAPDYTRMVKRMDIGSVVQSHKSFGIYYQSVIRRNILSKLSGRAQMILGSGLEKYQLILLETKDGLDAVADRGLGA